MPDLVIAFTYMLGTWVYILVLMCGELLFSAGFAKRKCFIARFWGSGAALFAIGAALSVALMYFEKAFPEPAAVSVGYIVMYAALFAAAMAAMRLSFEEPLLHCMTAGAMGYICQHISVDLYTILNAATSIEYILTVQLGISGYIICIALQLFCAAAVYFLVWLLFARRMGNFTLDEGMHKSVMFVVISSITIVLLLNSVKNFISDNIVAVIFVNIILIVCCILMLLLYSNIFNIKKAQTERDIVLRLNQSEHEHFLKLKQDMELVSVKCHDIKHFIAAAGAKGGVDLAELSEAVNIYDTTIKTGNEVIDTLIAERGLYCNAHGITLTVLADASGLGFINVTDMCALFGNILENAVEAAEKAEEGNRLINLNIRPVAGQIFVCAENTFSGKIKFKGGFPQTSKTGEEGYHGYGLKSIKMTAEKYGGVFSCRAEGGLFRVSILFPAADARI